MLNAPDVVRQSFLQWLAMGDSARQDAYIAYREYYDGEHDTQMTARQRKYLQIKMGEEFNDNYCFPLGTPVVTIAGLRPIEEVCQGDLALGHDGEFHEVLQTMAREIEESIVRLRTYGSPPLEMTVDHPVYATRLDSLETITNKHAVGHNTFRCYGTKPNKSYYLKSLQRDWVKAGDLQKGDIVWCPVYAGTNIKRQIAEYDPRLLRLLGWYLSEGSVSDNGRLAFSFHANEVTYQADVERLLQALYGPLHITRVEVSENSVQVVTYSKELCDRFEKLGGRGAAGKKIAPHIFNSGFLLTELLATAWAGDGYVGQRQGEYATVSIELANQIQTLLLRHGIVAGWQTRPERPGHRESYSITVSGEAMCTFTDRVLGQRFVDSRVYEKAPTGIIVDGYVGYAIAESESVEYAGPVYNFETRDVHSYTLAGQIAVHNCPIVVDALSERLTVTGFDAGEQSPTLWEMWTSNRMDGVQNAVHLSAVRDGDMYLIVEWDNESEAVAFIPELAYDGAEGVKVHYSKEKRRQISFASKRWRIEQGPEVGYMRRMNLYFPDHIEKYVSHAQENEGQWMPYIEEGTLAEEGMGVLGRCGWLWWTTTLSEKGDPLGVPVMHFKNRDQGYNHGQSELKSVIPLQNALNKSIIDLLAAADTTGFRMLTAIGFDPGGMDIAPGSWLWTEHPPSGEDSAAIGFIPGEDLAPLVAVKDAFVTEIARVSRTPLSYFQMTGQVAAEGTQKQQEVGLVARAKDRQVGFGNCLYGKTRIVMADGSTEAIERVVKYQMSGPALAIDETTGRIVCAEITQWYRNPRKGRCMIGLYYASAGGKSNRSKAYMTEDHLVLLKRGWVRAKEVISGEDEIATGEPAPNEQQLSLIIGALLGDAHLDDRRTGAARLIFVHGEDQREWMEIKRGALQGLRMGSILSRPGNRGHKQVLRCQSRTWGYLKRLHTQFYPDGKYKVVPREMVMRHLDPVGLATWYLDDGCLKYNTNGRGNPYATIATCLFDIEDVRWLAALLRQKWGIESSVLMSDGYPRIFLTVEGTRTLSRVIAPYVPYSMQYKILPEDRAYIPSLWDLGLPEVFYDTGFVLPNVPSTVEGRSSVYDIGVTGAHNFLTLGGVVHNSWEDALIMARRLHNVFGDGKLDEAQSISTQWADPETRNEKEHLETLTLKKGLEIPLEQLWGEMEYDATEIAAMKAMRGEELARTSNLGGELLRAFEQGR